jgi:1-acyl-sn-glycerol-3-phosphate acyltransferase
MLDWVFTVPFIVAFGGTLLVFDPLQRIARRLGTRAHEIVVGLLQATIVLSLRICGTRFFVERSPEVRPGTPYLLVANHQSMFDIPIIGSYLFTNYPKYVSKRELATGIPSISYNLRYGGNALIDRGDREQALAAIEDLGHRVAERGVSAVIFPEGTRAREGELAPFKPAGSAALLASAPHLPVVPVAIDATWKLLRYGLRPVPFGTRVRVRFGAPIAREPGEDPAKVVERARLEIAATIEAWRCA